VNIDANENPPIAAARQLPWSDRSERSAEKLGHRLAGDLDTIVLSAMHKEPQRRYASVEQFAADIRRHLDGLPVAARPDSFRYRAGKFIRRHRLGVSASALFLLVVLAGVAATVREARIAAANERRAEERFNDVRKLANSLMFEIHDAIRDLPGSISARRLLVTRAQEYLDSLNAQSRGDVSLQKELAAAYERVGDVLGYPYGANLGDKPGALQSYRKALAIRQSLALSASDLPLQRDIAGNYIRIAQVLESNGSFSEALEALAKARDIVRGFAQGSSDPSMADQYAGSYYFTAIVQVETGDIHGALENYQQASAVRAPALAAHPDNMPLRSHLAADYAGIAKCMQLNRDLGHAIDMQTRAIGILEQLSIQYPQNAAITEYLGEAVNRLGTYRAENGENAAALESFRRSHAIFQGLLAADPKNSLAKSNFAFSNNGIAQSLMKAGRLRSAADEFSKSIATFEEMSPRTASARYPRSGLAQAYYGLGEAYTRLAADPRSPADLRQRYWTAAHSACEKSVAVWNEKEKRGELESGERAEPSLATHCVDTSAAQMTALSAKQENLR